MEIINLTKYYSYVRRIEAYRSFCGGGKSFRSKVGTCIENYTTNNNKTSIK
ncbi:MAG: hypothetical protein Q8K70_12940 [Bacteroidota bacterium]|nr:hypothetical protein [Bacteroidota bacterium]